MTTNIGGGGAFREGFFRTCARSCGDLTTLERASGMQSHEWRAILGSWYLSREDSAPSDRQEEDIWTQLPRSRNTDGSQNKQTPDSVDDRDVATALPKAVAALLTFLQANLTGPLVNLPEAGLAEARQDASQKAELGQERISATDKVALQQLSADGEEVEGTCCLPQQLATARQLLLQPLRLEECGQAGEGAASAIAELPTLLARLPFSWAWWTVRMLSLQQRLLSGPSHSLSELLRKLIPHMLKSAMEAEGLPGGLRKRALALAHLEAALVEQLYSNPAASGLHIAAASQAVGFSAELSGALGMRTVHQLDPKAQLVVTTSQSRAGNSGDAESAIALDEAAASALKGQALMQDEPSDILDSLRLTDSGGESSRGELEDIEQSILIALAEQQKRATARDEMQGWQVAAYADAVIGQSKTRFLLRCAARLYRIRFERLRSRTKSRALLAMQQLVDAAAAGFPPLQARMLFAFSTMLPLRASLRKELGEQLVANGLVGEAMHIFEELELWDSLLICYRLLEKLPRALNLVQNRLKANPDDARLLCALGDLVGDPKHYEEAWEKSGRRHARAQRSLARLAMSKSEFGKAAEHWRLALRINPLHPEGWFAIGFCFLKLQDSQQARQAFTSCTQQQPDNSEAWNNVAAIHLKEGNFKEAYSALSEAVKYKHDSWQTWSNLATAATQTGNYQHAARAVEQVGNLTQWQKQDTQVLQALVKAVSAARMQAGTFGQPQQGEVRGGQRLLERSIQNTLKAAVSSAAVSPATWGLVAQLNQALGYPDSAKDALRKQVRGLAGTAWQKDPALFQEYVSAAIATARFALQQSKAGDASARKELASSRMLLQSILKSAGEKDERESMTKEVEKVLAEIQSREQ